MLTEIILSLLILFLILAWIATRNSQNKKLSDLKYQLAKSEARNKELAEDFEYMKIDKIKLEKEFDFLVSKNGELQNIREENRKIEEKCNILRNELAETKADLKSERKIFAEKIRLTEKNKEQMTEEFENLATRIMEANAESLRLRQTGSLKEIISPLKNQLDGFKTKIEEIYLDEAKDRSSLKTELKQLKEINQQISEDAVNLTNALKGDSKFQGSWGEIKLERILEDSGLQKNLEYESQVSLTCKSGKIFRPDAVIHLPDGKDIVVDAKMSLTAFERYFNSEDSTAKETFLNEHIKSVTSHIKELTSKNYHELNGINSLDFVLMFIPVESAFLLANQKSPEMFSKALAKNIFIVSPSTLIVTLRTIHNIWRNEHQHRNVKKIAERGALLFDKFSDFVKDMEQIGINLEKANFSYQKSMNKLSSGNGNLINQARQLKELGLRTKKELPEKFLAVE
ncbi:MAG: DNA recombination protein RmuC [Candidatus Cloacimonadota bacterium]|nr:MAG: DNA recombination protein RmuC [Candidatus Cloacimonadota bacterium]